MQLAAQNVVSIYSKNASLLHSCQLTHKERNSVARPSAILKNTAAQTLEESETNSAPLVEVLIVISLWEVKLEDDSSRNQSVCAGFLFTVVRSLLAANQAIHKRKLSVFFDLSGKVDPGVLFFELYSE